MILPRYCVGIDVSKATLDIFDEALGTPERIANAPQAIATLVARWRAGATFVVFEATGAYDRALAAALHQAGVPCARVNPARARAFARAGGRLAKTDAIDARMLAGFARAMAPAADQADDPARAGLKELAKRRDQLVLARAQEKTRGREATAPAMRDSIARHLAFLDSEIKTVEAAIDALIEVSPDIAGQARLIRSAPGIGPVACLHIIARMPELGQRGPKPLAALAGLAPFNVDSGRYRGRRMIGAGRKRLRDALYMAALNAVRREGPLKLFYARLRSAGKPAKLALIAAARKLLTILNAMLRDNQIYRNQHPA